MNITLTHEEVRVLGSLVEKEMTTPDGYPLSLNALVNACNQKTSREPVVNYDEATVQVTVRSLNLKNLVKNVMGGEHRVPKYKHEFPTVFNLTRSQTAVLCTLMLRGPQTAAEIRERSERLRPSEGLPDIAVTLEELAHREEGPFVVLLPRRPGQSAQRWMHLLAGPPTEADLNPPEAAPAPSGDRIGKLEQEMSALREDMTRLRQEFVEFKKQFE